MLFRSEQEALDWYEHQERVLTPNFLKTIPWHDVAKHTLHERFAPVLCYMRDVEKFTELYYRELKRTPTGKDPVIGRFMDRWMHEEALHGDLLNRFLNEAGFPTSYRWFEEAKEKIPRRFRVTSHAVPWVTNLIGDHFSAVHMTWGAINELSTLNGYQRLADLAEHPVLKYLLDGICREEARHSFFYWNIARLKLSATAFRQRLSRFVVNKFWAPVGEGAKSTSDANYVIATLFSGDDGLQAFTQRVSRRIGELPGFQNFTRLDERVAEASQSRAT